MSAVTTVPPAGWYEDDMVPGRERWWDGDRWTDRVRRSNFGLDCWASELDRAFSGSADAPSAHRTSGGRWSDAAIVGADPIEGAPELLTTGLADADADPVDAWDLAADDLTVQSEIGPVVVQIAVDADIDDQTAVARSIRGSGTARGTSTTRGVRKQPRDRRPSGPARPAPSTRTSAPDPAPADHVGAGLGADDSWAPSPALAAEPFETVSSEDWVRAVAPTVLHDWETEPDDETPSAPANDMSGRPLADAAAVMAALAALSAPIEEAPAHPTATRSSATRSSATRGTWGDEPVDPARAAADAVVVPASAGESATSSQQPVAGETEVVRVEDTGPTPTIEPKERGRRRSVPPRPTLAPLAEAGTGVTSHTFTKVDREALDAAMALSAMVSPGTGGRTVSPGARAPQPAAPTAPVAPTEAPAEEIVEAATPVAGPRPDRPARPAPPVPRWNDTQPSVDEADTGFVRISSRDRQKRVLGT